MNRFSIILFALVAGLCAWAQLAIDRHTIESGGGISTGGVHSVNGTVGQYEANPFQVTGGPFTLDGGFWTVYAVQTAGAPYLSIVPAGPGQALISWMPDAPGWILQQSESLTNSWSDSPSMSTNPVAVPLTQSTRFYRLIKP